MAENNTQVGKELRLQLATKSVVAFAYIKVSTGEERVAIGTIREELIKDKQEMSAPDMRTFLSLFTMLEEEHASGVIKEEDYKEAKADLKDRVVKFLETLKPKGKKVAVANVSEYDAPINYYDLEVGGWRSCKQGTVTRIIEIQ